MHKPFSALILTVILLLLPSCRKLKDYFRDPETEILTETIHSAVLTGYSANIAMAVMGGQTFPNVLSSRSNSGFPCTTTMIVDLTNVSHPSFAAEKAGTVTIAGLWPDANTAVLTLLYTDYHTGTSTLDLIGIETVPVIRDGNNIQVAMASMDVRFNPNKESILSLNLTTFEIQSELFRLEQPRPADVYVAVTQNAYFIDVNNHGTVNNPDDDDYTITGGGQLIEVAGNSAEIVQQAMVEMKITSGCDAGPVAGMAIIRVTGVEDEGFPELGTAVLQCSSNCDGMAKVFVATGMYAGSNGRKTAFRL